MTRRTPRRLIAGAVALSCGIGAASAIAASKPKPAAKAAPSKIVYVCGKNLCAVDPISRTTTRVTTDNGGYRWPSVSANGQRVAAVGGGGIRAGRYGTNLPEKWSGVIEGINGLAMSPNGRQIAATHWYTRLEQKYVYSYTCGSSYSCVQLQLQHYNGTQVYTKPNTPTSQRGDSGPGYLGGALLSTGQDYGEWDSTVSDYVGGTVSVCSIASPTAADPTCTTRVTLPNPPAPGARRVHLSNPTGSRDGRLIAVTIGDVWERQARSSTSRGERTPASASSTPAPVPRSRFTPTESVPRSPRTVVTSCLREPTETSGWPPLGAVPHGASRRDSSRRGRRGQSSPRRSPGRRRGCGRPPHRCGCAAPRPSCVPASDASPSAPGRAPWPPHGSRSSGGRHGPSPCGSPRWDGA